MGPACDTAVRRRLASSGGKASGIELAAVVEVEPVADVLVFLMTGIGEDLDQPRIARPAPGVLRRAGILARDAQRATHARLGDPRFLDGDFVFPVVAEVVGVQEAVA